MSEPSLLNEAHEAPGGEGFGDGFDAVNGIDGHGALLLSISVAVGGGPDELSIADEGDACAGDGVTIEEAGDAGIEAPGEGVEGLARVGRR